MILIPIAHEDQTVQRLPWVTIGLIAANVAVFLATLPAADRQATEIHRRTREVVQFVRAHPYLRLPEELAGDIPAESAPAHLSAEAVAEQQARLDRLLKELQEAASGSIYRTLGYVPSRPNLIALFTSLFMHGGWFHLIGNMLFLWLAGPSLEDRWGRVFYSVMYFASGSGATILHVGISPGSDVPLIGASGAIAGLLGAFLVRVGGTRIRFFYWIFLLRIFTGTFYARAYVALPLWLLQQFAMALLGEETGVAVWAHIGGFGMGAVVALLIRATDLEARVLAPAVEKKTTWTPTDRLAAALGKLDRGDAPGAVRDLEALSRARPGDLDTRMALMTAYAAQGNRVAAGRESARIVAQHLKARDMDGALAAFREHAAAYHEVPLPIRDQLALAAHCEQLREYQDAADLYQAALRAWPDDAFTPKARVAYARIKLEVFKRADDVADLLERAAAHPQATPEIQRAAAVGLATARNALRPSWRGPAPAPATAAGPPRVEAPPPAPQPQAPIPAEPLAADPAHPIPGGGRLIPVTARAVGIDTRGLHLQDRQGRTAVMAWQKIAAVSVAIIGGEVEGDEIAGHLILDLVLASRQTPGGAEYRCIRLMRQDLAIPQLQGEPSPVRAVRRLVATILKATGAAAYPNREACLTLQGLPPFLDAGIYDEDLLARLTAAG